MNGLMMDYPLTLSTIFRRAETIYPRQEIVWRLADKSIHRYTYGDFADPRPPPRPRPARPRHRPGDRVATLGWNHGPHLEAYFGIPLWAACSTRSTSASTPTSSPTSSTTPTTRAMLVDESLLPLWEQVRPQVSVDQDGHRRRRDQAGGRTAISNTKR